MAGSQMSLEPCMKGILPPRFQGPWGSQVIGVFRIPIARASVSSRKNPSLNTRAAVTANEKVGQKGQPWLGNTCLGSRAEKQ